MWRARRPRSYQLRRSRKSPQKNSKKTHQRRRNKITTIKSRLRKKNLKITTHQKMKTWIKVNMMTTLIVSPTLRKKN